MMIDLNSDLGEGFGRWKSGEDEALMPLISSANVACGYHAGDAAIMTRTVEMAKAHGVDVGAHVGLPDKLGFGRVAMDIDPRELAKHALYQLGALYAIAKAQGVRVVHAGGHGAMDAMSRKNPAYNERMMEVFAAFDKDLIIRAMPNGNKAAFAKSLGLRTIGLIFADRAYDDDGNLVNRAIPNSVITDEEVVVQRVSQFMHDSTITAMSGKIIKFDAKSILVHSDTPGAVQIAQAVRRTVEAGGGKVVPASRMLD
ncbi:LamB/YcsF family protein [Rhodovarius crocodyli]|uniref:LamB/YcsF family protein n=1 Tax=Rhodovarius crocodyli TaxID=1979269 RepID=A0A437MDK0_9PROT|nr:5-oxoprolinase subunit PxpA [Rhodovarius crocodyli]RVT95734.1 LamB/YcsF family protein [Rhodovarius crocodyli]